MKVVYVTSRGGVLRRTGERLELVLQREVRSTVPLHDLGQLVVQGGVTITPAAIDAMLDRGVDVVLLSASGNYRGRIVTGASGNARLLFAMGPDGDAQAALFLVRCGSRVVEPYGGMTAAGAASRANYLIKWEAIVTSRAAGATSYDLWGLVNPGIAHFKAGFGGREIRYIGGFELDLARVGAPVVRTAAGLRQRFRGPATRAAEPTG